MSSAYSKFPFIKTLVSYVNIGIKNLAYSR